MGTKRSKLTDKKTILTIASLSIISITLATSAIWFVTSNKKEQVPNVKKRDPSEEWIVKGREWHYYNGEAGRLGDKLEATLPESDYGGIWVDERGRIQVGIIDKSETSAESRATALTFAKELGYEDGTDVVIVENSWATLMQVTLSIENLYREHVGYGNEFWAINSGIKTDLNKVRVTIPEDENRITAGHKIVLAEIEKHYKNQTYIETYSQPARLQ